MLHLVLLAASRCCCWGIIGGVVGAIAGSDIAQTNNQKDDSNDWQEEDNYWRENYKKCHIILKTRI